MKTLKYEYNQEDCSMHLERRPRTTGSPSLHEFDSSALGSWRERKQAGKHAP
jgi:hypothetical protein